MQVNGLSAAADPKLAAGKTATNKSGADLNIDDFFKLISAQLQNQSMFDTVDNAQFMSQMVQFSTLSQINSLTNAFQSNFAVSLIGKPVSISATDDQGKQQITTGQVEQVSFNAGTPYVLVNGEFHQMSEILDIGPELSATTDKDTNGTAALEPEITQK
jgi:flagellar basal-body rod modification protein FlgD